MEPSGARVVLYTRQGCHLCGAARALVSEESAKAGASWEEIDVASDPELELEHGELVPVVVVDGVRRGFWRIDPERLRRALTATSPPTPLSQ